MTRQRLAKIALWAAVTFILLRLLDCAMDADARNLCDRDPNPTSGVCQQGYGD